MAVNTAFRRPSQARREQAEMPELDEDRLAEHLSNVIRYKTVTAKTMDGFDREAFLGLHEYLEKAYPLLHRTLEKEVVNEYSLLYRWKNAARTKAVADDGAHGRGAGGQARRKMGARRSPATSRTATVEPRRSGHEGPTGVHHGVRGAPSGAGFVPKGISTSRSGTMRNPWTRWARCASWTAEGKACGWIS